MLSNFFIGRPKFAFVIAIVIALAGVIALQLIPVAEYPDITPPVVNVSTVYTGANASVVEQSVAAPIEAQVNGVDDMLYMSSTSGNDGSYSLDVTFAVGTDPDIAAVNVQNRVAIATGQLPSDVTRNGVTTRKQSTSMLMVINIVSPEGTHDSLFISNYASIYIQDELARINGVGGVQQFGARDYGMRVWLDRDRLTALELTAADVEDAIRAQNIQATAGQIGAPPYESTPQFQYSLQAKGRLISVEEFENIVVRAGNDGTFVRLRDVARVELGSQTYAAISSVNNQPAANIAIYQSPGANALGIADEIYAELERLSESFPPGMEYDILYDTTKAVRASVQEVIQTLMLTFVLVVGVTFLFLGDWRSTIVPTVAIPVSLVGTFAVLLLAGYSANMITLFAIILAIGIVVDDSIVVVENVQRIMDETGLAAPAATRQAMGEVTGPVIATTLVLLAVFVPVSFMPGITGELYRQFSVTICVAVSLSSISALTLAPAMCAILLKPGSGRPRGPLGWFAKLVDKSRDGYVWLVRRLIRGVLVTLIIFGGFAWGAYHLFTIVPTGFLPIEDKGALLGNIQLPDGASLARTDTVVKQAVDEVRSVEGVTDAISVAGFSMLAGAASNTALIIPILADWDERTTFETRWFMIMNAINQRLAALPSADAFTFPSPPIVGLGRGGGIELQVQAYGGGTPQELAAAVRSLVFAANQAPELTGVFSTYSANVPQYLLDIDRDKAQVLGIPISTIFSALQANLGSSYINDFNLYGKVYRVIVQAEARDRNKIEDIYQLHIRSAEGEMVPLQALVDIEPVLGPLSIKRYNQFKSAPMNGSPAEDYSTGDAIAAMERVAATALPEGYGILWTGTSQQEIEAGGLVVIIFGLAFVFAYLFLVAQYESWPIPSSVMLSVIIAAFGALVPLALLPFLNNNLYAQIGMVMLIGLASKSAILIVEFAKVRRESGLDTEAAAIEAARLRFRAVMMTALSFIFGVLPLIFATGAGAASRVSVGFVVFGGMVAATAIGIFFIPVLYYAVQRLRDRIKREPVTTPIEAE